MELPDLDPLTLGPTRDYLHDAAKVLGKLQQAFLAPSPRDWHYGLEVTMRGLATQAFDLNGRPARALLDLVGHKLRLGDQYWRLRENPPGQLLAEARQWLAGQGSDAQIAEPELGNGIVEYDHAQADAYAAGLWWYDARFRELKASLTGGVTAPILLYPHHFDLSLVWFPWDDERQVAIGWSTGDTTIPEPYTYLTAYPEPKGFTKLELPPEAHWQTDGFSGAVLPHSQLVDSQNPEELFSAFAQSLFDESKKLLSQ